MSLFDKLIIPIIEPTLKSMDFTSLTGFKGCYTSDPDKPTWKKQFFLAFDDTVHNKYTEDLHRRFSKSLNIDRSYIKIVDNKPLYIVSFFVRPELKKLYEGSVQIKHDHKMKYLKFWSDFDEYAEKLCSTTSFVLSSKEELPLEDYKPSFLHKAY